MLPRTLHGITTYTPRHTLGSLSTVLAITALFRGPKQEPYKKFSYIYTFTYTQKQTYIHAQVHEIHIYSNIHIVLYLYFVMVLWEQ